MTVSHQFKRWGGREVAAGDGCLFIWAFSLWRSDSQQYPWSHSTCKSHTQRCFMAPVLVFQDSLVKRPQRTCKSRWKTRAGRTGRLHSAVSVVPALPPPAPLSPPSQRHHLCSHPSFSWPNPSAPLAVSKLDENIELCLHLLLKHLLPPAAVCSAGEYCYWCHVQAGSKKRP